MAESPNELEIVIRAKAAVQQAFDEAQGRIRTFETRTHQSMRNISAEMEKFNYAHYTALNAVGKREAELLGLQTSAVARRRELMAMDTDSLEALYQKHLQFTNGVGRMGATWQQTLTAISTTGTFVLQGLQMAFGLVQGAIQLVIGTLDNLKNLLSDALKTTVAWAEGTERLHQQLGISADQASRLMFVSQSLTGSTSDLNQLFGALARQVELTSFMQEKAAAAADKHTKAGKATAGAIQALVNLDNPLRAALTRWSINFQDLNGTQDAALQLFQRIIAKGHDLGDTFERDRLTVDIFRQSSDLMLELMDRGPDEFKRMMEAASQYGVVIGPEQAENAQRFVIAQNQMGLALDSLKMNFMLPLLPALQTIMAKTGEWVAGHKDAFAQAGQAVADFVSRHIQPFFDFLDKKGPTILAAFSEALLKVFNGLTKNTFKTWDDFLTSFNKISDKDVEGTLNGLAGSLLNVASAIGTIGDAFHKAGDFFSFLGGTAHAPLAVAQGSIDALWAFLNGQRPNTANRITQLMTSDQSYIGPDGGLYDRTTGQRVRATGGFSSGKTVVGERGPEMVDLPAGSYVHTADETRQMASGGQTFHNTFHIKNESDPIAIARYLSFQMSHAGRF